MQADFSWNAVGTKGTQRIAEGLQGQAQLVRLNLAWNGLGDKGAEHMGGALRSNGTLQFLDVASNRIGLPGSRFIAEGLEENTTLRSLQLNGNPISDKGVDAIIKAVGIQCSVRDLGLQDCSTTEDFLSKSGKGIFDPRNPTGEYKLNLADEVRRSKALHRALTPLSLSLFSSHTPPSCVSSLTLIASRS